MHPVFQDTVVSYAVKKEKGLEVVTVMEVAVKVVLALIFVVFSCNS